MLHMQSPYGSTTASGGQPAYDWSSEISAPGQAGVPQSSQTTTTHTTSSQNSLGQTTTTHTTTSQTMPYPSASSQAPSAPSAPTQTTPAQTPPAQAAPAQAPAQAAPDSQDFSAQDALNSRVSPGPYLAPSVRPAPSASVLDLRHHQSDEVIQSPTTLEEAQMGSMKNVLNQNLGNYVVATFLVGTQGTTAWEGELFEVGNDYLIIHQTGRDRYIVCDIYSLKYIEFYDTQRQEICDNLMRNQGWQDNGWRQNG